MESSPDRDKAEKEKEKGNGKEKGSQPAFDKSWEVEVPRFQYYTPLNSDTEGFKP